MASVAARKSAVPARIVWAVEQLTLAPRQRLLEVGCGAGHALALVHQRFESAFVTGIDRSRLQVERARRLNAEAIASGRLNVQQLSLEAAARELPSAAHAVVLAINVNAFWTQPAPSFASAATLLGQAGLLELVYQPPSTAAVSRLEAELSRFAAAAGFRLSSARRRRAGQGALLCVVFQRPAAASRRSK